MAEAKKKDGRFTLMRAIAMIIIVAAHASDGSINLFFDWIPYMGTILSVLIFAGGYFYRERNEETPFRFIGKKAYTLLLPMYILNFVYGLIVLFLRRWGFTIGGDLTLRNLLLAPLYDGHQFEYNLAGWYVVPLFCAEVIYLFIRRFFKLIRMEKRESLVMLFCLLLGIGGLELSIKGFSEGWWRMIVRALYFLVFFALGVYYKRVLEKYDRLPNIVYFAIIALIQLTLLHFCHRIPIYVISWSRDFTDGPLVPYIIGTVGVAFWLRMARILDPGCGQDKAAILIADNSYSIMINQFAGFMILKTVYALLSRCTGAFADFDMLSYKTDLWYFYTPPSLPFYSLIFYVAAGTGIPILMSLIWKKIFGKIKKAIKKEAE